LFLHRLALTLLLLGVIATAALLSQRIREDGGSPPEFKEDLSLPHYQEVENIIRGLSYNGFYALLRSDVDLEIDFDKRQWLLKNIHNFDSEGRVTLEKGRYGLCGQLSDNVARRIQPLFGDQYSMVFVHCAESGYFLGPRSSHYVLKLTDSANPGNVFVIDPSFARYGRLEAFEDYLFYDASDRIFFEKDVFFAAGVAMPIVIRRDFIVDLSVEGGEDEFDRDNFTIALVCTRRYRFSGRYIFALRLIHGLPQVYENKALAEFLLDEGMYKTLKARLTGWFVENSKKNHPSLDLSALEIS